MSTLLLVPDKRTPWITNFSIKSTKAGSWAATGGGEGETAGCGLATGIERTAGAGLAATTVGLGMAGVGAGRAETVLGVLVTGADCGGAGEEG